MESYFLVEHDDWDEPRKIYEGPNTNAYGLHKHCVCQTIGSSYECMWRLPDTSLPGVVAIIAHARYRRNYIYELCPEDYGSLEADDFAKRKPIYRKVLEDFGVAGYRFLSFHEVPDPDRQVVEADDSDLYSVSDRIRAACIKSWDGHMSPGDWEGHARDLAAHQAYQRGEDIYEIVRKEREARDHKLKHMRAPGNDNEV